MYFYRQSYAIERFHKGNRVSPPDQYSLLQWAAVHPLLILQHERHKWYSGTEPAFRGTFSTLRHCDGNCAFQYIIHDCVWKPVSVTFCGHLQEFATHDKLLYCEFSLCWPSAGVVSSAIFGDVGYSWILALWSDPVHFLDVGGCVVVYWLHNNTVCHQRWPLYRNNSTSPTWNYHVREESLLDYFPCVDCLPCDLYRTGVWLATWPEVSKRSKLSCEQRARVRFIFSDGIILYPIVHNCLRIQPHLQNCQRTLKKSSERGNHHVLGKVIHQKSKVTNPHRSVELQHDIERKLETEYVRAINKIQSAEKGR